MHYIIDGYNLLFKITAPYKDLREKREKILAYLQETLSHVSLTVVFEGMHRKEEENGFQYIGKVKVIFTPKGQTADEYITDFLELSSSPSEYTVVTSDRTLASHCRSLEAKTLEIPEFLHWMEKKSIPKQKEKNFRDSAKNIERLLKIFEKRFQEGEEEVF